MRLYNSIWRFASYKELSRVMISTLITSLFHMVIITLGYRRMPLSYYLFGMVIQFIFVLAVRFSYRFILLERERRTNFAKDREAGRVMLIGAGSAGQMILRDIMHSNETTDKVCCIIDDNRNKWNRDMDGVPVIGGRDEILFGVQKYKIDKIYVAIPSCNPEDKREILNICKET